MITEWGMASYIILFSARSLVFPHFITSFSSPNNCTTSNNASNFRFRFSVMFSNLSQPWSGGLFFKPMLESMFSLSRHSHPIITSLATNWRRQRQRQKTMISLAKWQSPTSQLKARSWLCTFKAMTWRGLFSMYSACGKKETPALGCIGLWQSRFTNETLYGTLNGKSYKCERTSQFQECHSHRKRWWRRALCRVLHSASSELSRWTFDWTQSG